MGKKVDKTTAVMLIYTMLYYIITFYFITDIIDNNRKIFEYFTIIPLFWLISGLILLLLFWKLKLKLRFLSHKILIFIASPLPLLIAFFIIALF